MMSDNLFANCRPFRTSLKDIWPRVSITWKHYCWIFSVLYYSRIYKKSSLYPDFEMITKAKNWIFCIRNYCKFFVIFPKAERNIFKSIQLPGAKPDDDKLVVCIRGYNTLDELLTAMIGAMTVNQNQNDRTGNRKNQLLHLNHQPIDWLRIPRNIYLTDFHTIFYYLLLSCSVLIEFHSRLQRHWNQFIRMETRWKCKTDEPSWSDHTDKWQTNCEYLQVSSCRNHNPTSKVWIKSSDWRNAIHLKCEHIRHASAANTFDTIVFHAGKKFST